MALQPERISELATSKLLLIAKLTRLRNLIGEFRQLDPNFTFELLLQEHSFRLGKVVLVCCPLNSLIDRVKFWYLSVFVHLDTPERRKLRWLIVIEYTDTRNI